MATLTFGKYSGKSLEQVASLDPDYLRWMAGENINRGGVNFSQEAARALQNQDQATKQCCYCQEAINGEAIPVQETFSRGRKVSQGHVRYLHPECAKEMAD